MTTFSIDQYTRFDPFEGDRDVDIRCRKIKVVTVKKEHVCFNSKCRGHNPHKIKSGNLARVETAIVEGKWRSWYICLPCIEAWFREIGIVPEINP